MPGIPSLNFRDQSFQENDEPINRGGSFDKTELVLRQLQIVKDSIESLTDEMQSLKQQVKHNSKVMGRLSQ